MIIAIYFAFQLSLFLVFLLLAKIKDRRLHQKHGKKVPLGFEKTDEVMMDPTTSKKFIVYYNAGSGERFYKEEGNEFVE